VHQQLSSFQRGFQHDYEWARNTGTHTGRTEYHDGMLQPCKSLIKNMCFVVRMSFNPVWLLRIRRNVDWNKSKPITNSMEQNPSSEANSCSASQEAIHYLDPRPCPKPFHILTHHFFKTNFNIILPSTRKPSKLSLPFRFTEWNFVCISHLFHACHVFIHFIPLDLITVIRFDGRSQWPCGLRRGSWPVGCWDRGFESRSRHGCLSASFCVVLCCVVLCCPV
jgi:hypothetical protein